MKQPTEYAVEFTNRLTAVWGFANNCILKSGGEAKKAEQPPNTKARKLLGQRSKVLL